MTTRGAEPLELRASPIDHPHYLALSGAADRACVRRGALVPRYLVREARRGSDEPVL